MLPLTGVEGDQASAAEEAVTSVLCRSPGVEGGVWVVNTATSGAGALR